ncbi:hypothetical protein MTR67_007062 [Solanum verrucosum]|uniref:Uncharacterized protein n=1 Tax=Solanum verrucosum TaxID=315347 RepID=A0AAF0PZ50_SOLVR|nr:hypothetical protein MTR67_007062 [Solanum verrucosum]
MNPTEFHGSKVKEDPQELIDKVYKVLDIMGVTPIEKVELTTNQHKVVAQIWFNQWKEARPVDAGPVEWERSHGSLGLRNYALLRSIVTPRDGRYEHGDFKDMLSVCGIMGCDTCIAHVCLEVA